eukprot:TRINITY_DN48120_c0_g1_i1.p1 TRINITY_DN48120_c0_g1~~TRINITY_DN48120_c0_g1_i1.p1  ORF type:complete len:324 (-),score=45.28 TRINITY_DN48120_c0_g1_i1:89-1060(-)
MVCKDMLCKLFYVVCFMGVFISVNATSNTLASLLSRLSDVDTNVKVAVGDRVVNVSLRSKRPLIYEIAGMINEGEAMQIMELAAQNGFEQSGSGYGESHRKSISSFLAVGQQVIRDNPMAPVVNSLGLRLASLMNVSSDKVHEWAHVSVVAYAADDFYLPHFDSTHISQLQPRSAAEAAAGQWNYPAAPRATTLFCILQAPEKGGETTFPLSKSAAGLGPSYPSESAAIKKVAELKFWQRKMAKLCRGKSQSTLSFVPRNGFCLLWSNHLMDEDGVTGELDHRSLHAGCNVIKGLKVAMNWWLTVPPPDPSAMDERGTSKQEL